MVHFGNITVQCKDLDDWRAFLSWIDTERNMIYDIRGYGTTPGAAADDAYSKYCEDRELYTDSGTVWDRTKESHQSS